MSSYLSWSDSELTSHARKLAHQLNTKYLTETRKKEIKRDLDHVIFETVMRKR